MTLSRRWLALVAVLLLVAAAIAGAAWQYRREHAFPAGLIQANGRIESDTITVASKYAGRVAKLAAREGDSVAPGQLLVQLDDATVRAQLQQAQAALAQAVAQAAAARESLAVLRREVPNSIGNAQAGVRVAEAALTKAGAAEQQSKRDAERAERLAKVHFVNPQAAEQAELAWRVARDQLAAARAGREQAVHALRDAELGPQRVKASEAQLAALEAARGQAQARIGEVRSVLDDLAVKSPAQAIVTTRFVNLGEVVNAGSPLFELVDLDRLYLKVYVPEVQIGKLRRGLPARIYTDAFPGQPFDATVRYIGSRAEFTPKEVQTPDERVKLVYEVRLYLDRNPGHRLTPGLPADAVIRWREDAPWAKPRW